MPPGGAGYSISYDLYPGFWYTVGLGTECFYDLDTDGDVDGLDLATAARGLREVPISVMAEEFGRNDCPIP